LTIGNGPYFRNEGGALAIASSGGTFPYLATRLRLMDELETHKPPFPQFGAGRPFHVRFPEGVRAWLDRFYYDVALSGGGAPMAALSALARPERILYGSDWPFCGARLRRRSTQ
jgi:hypothetical protein